MLCATFNYFEVSINFLLNAMLNNEYDNGQVHFFTFKEKLKPDRIQIHHSVQMICDFESKLSKCNGKTISYRILFFYKLQVNIALRDHWPFQNNLLILNLGMVFYYLMIRHIRVSLLSCLSNEYFFFLLFTSDKFRALY